MNTEVWKPIPGTSYEASDQGQIRREGGRILKPRQAAKHYLKLTLRGRQEYVHRLVATAWIGPIRERWEVNHLNFDRQDNRPANLEICTRKQNTSHAAAPLWYQNQLKLFAV
jgi:hypothetical protein